MGEAWIIDAVRTARGRGKPDVGALSRVHPQQLLGQVLEALRQRNGFDPADVDDVVAGCVSAVGEQAACIARNAVLAARWDPRTASGVTLNRFCGSGQQAVNFAAMGVMAAMARITEASASPPEPASFGFCRSRPYRVRHLRDHRDTVTWISTVS